MTAASGIAETFSWPGGATGSRIVPLQHPKYQDAYAESVTASPLPGSCCSLIETTEGTDEGIQYPIWDWYLGEVRFRTPKWGTEGDYPLITRTLDSGADIVTRPGSAYQFASDGLKLKQDVGVFVPTIDFSLAFHKLPALNESLYISLAGRVNSIAFYGCAAGTVQYVGPHTQGERRTGNVVTWELVHKFKFRWIPHNILMRPTGTGGPSGTGFDTPVDGYGNGLLPTADLNALWSN
jgi:hypothetical protein